MTTITQVFLDHAKRSHNYLLLFCSYLRASTTIACDIGAYAGLTWQAPGMMRTDRWRVRSGCEFSTRALDFYSSLRFADLKRKPSNLLLAGFRKHSGQGIRRRLVHQNAGDCIFLLVLATQSCEGQGAFRACLYRSMVSIGCMLGQGYASPLYGRIPPRLGR